jgi:DNA-nicking Smr family endonuclease
MASRARALTEVDAAEWALFARRIAPLRGRRAIVPPDISVQGAPPEAVRFETRTTPPARAVFLGVGDQPPGVDSAAWRQLHRARGTRKLDLHGMTAQHAFAALRTFLRSAHADRVRCVEIVTGRGKEGSGVLRRELPLWLNLPDIRPMVLAAAHPQTSSAMHAHTANPGSVRLLLRRPRA